MVFVHARNETVRTANVLCDMSKNMGDSQIFSPEQNPRYGDAEKQVWSRVFVKSQLKKIVLNIFICSYSCLSCDLI